MEAASAGPGSAAGLPGAAGAAAVPGTAPCAPAVLLQPSQPQPASQHLRVLPRAAGSAAQGRAAAG